jgi:glutathione S-transferase
MELFFSRMSGNSGRAVFAMIESGAAWTQHPIAPHARDEEHLAVNPMGKVPALRDGAFSLWESNAINWYVAEKHPESQLLPASIAGRAAVQRWLYFQAGHISPACVPVFMARHPRMQAFWNRRGDDSKAQAALQELERFVPVLESALSGRDWLEGAFSLADVAYAPHFQLLVQTGFSFSPYPRTARWLERLWARSAWQQTATLLYSG